MDENEKKGLKNKAGYTAQDAPSMRDFHLRKKHGMDGPTDGVKWSEFIMQ